MKIYTERNVVDAAYDRIELAFNEFDNIYLSVSGGKDSSVMMQFAHTLAKKMGKKYSVLFIDLEAQYKATIDHMYELIDMCEETIDRIYWICLPLSLRNAVSVIQPKWICWDEKDKEKWVRPMPQEEYIINMDNKPEEWTWFERGQEFEEFILYFAQWFNEKFGGNTGSGIAIRSNESLNRFRTITSTKKESYKDWWLKDKLHHKNIVYEELDDGGLKIDTGIIPPEKKEDFNLQKYCENHGIEIPERFKESWGWTTRVRIGTKSLQTFNYYPLYDWRADDIWGAISQFDMPYNEIYELMYKNGLSIYQQRLCQPYGDDQKNGLDQFRSLEPETWEKVLHRVHGVNYGNIYCRTSLLGNIKSEKPENMTWEQYAVWLLETIGLYAPELRDHYYRKIRKFLDWWEEKGGIPVSEIPDEGDRKLESKKKVPSWRRVARAVERNDFWMKRLSFSQTKSDVKIMFDLKKKYQNLVDENTTTDGQLKKMAKKLNDIAESS